MAHVEQITVQTRTQVEMINIDRQIQDIVYNSGIQDGLVTIFVPHTTAAVTINENADPDVIWDMNMELNKIIPHNDIYRHIEGNSAAHIKCTLTGASETVLIEKGKMLMGTWQSIFFCEYDGPRARKVLVKIFAG
ncbi:secondary thiamine-phosphate synthase enzyme YjbQ [bacterium]|nr:secondary thiamine-phosphate synthase enzyme YjbQ [bacterium]